MLVITSREQQKDIAATKSFSSTYFVCHFYFFLLLLLNSLKNSAEAQSMQFLVKLETLVLTW
jgi:hypothetical protein